MNPVFGLKKLVRITIKRKFKFKLKWSSQLFHVPIIIKDFLHFHSFLIFVSQTLKPAIWNDLKLLLFHMGFLVGVMTSIVVEILTSYLFL